MHLGALKTIQCCSRRRDTLVCLKGKEKTHEGFFNHKKDEQFLLDSSGGSLWLFKYYHLEPAVPLLCRTFEDAVLHSNLYSSQQGA